MPDIAPASAEITWRSSLLYFLDMRSALLDVVRAPLRMLLEREAAAEILTARTAVRRLVYPVIACPTPTEAITLMRFSRIAEKAVSSVSAVSPTPAPEIWSHKVGRSIPRSGTGGVGEDRAGAPGGATASES